MQRPDSICPLQQNARDRPPTWSRLPLTQERNLKQMPICILFMLPLPSGLGRNARLTSSIFGFRLIGHPLCFTSCNTEKTNIGKTIHCGLMSRASDSSKLARERADALQSRVLHYHMGKMDRDGDIPTLTGKLKVDWIDFPVEDILEQFPP